MWHERIDSLSTSYDIVMDNRKRILEEIIASLEKESIFPTEWSWNRNVFVPNNPVSKVRYVGMNNYILTLEAMKNNYNDNRWVTFKQAIKEGWKIKVGAKFWLKVCTELKNRGIKDILIACIDGLKGFPEAIQTIFPDTKIQLCIIHQIRNSFKYISYILFNSSNAISKVRPFSWTVFGINPVQKWFSFPPIFNNYSYDW